MNKSIIGMILLWITGGGALALWQPPAITWESLWDGARMLTMVGGRLGAAGLTNSSETAIWTGITALSALLLAWKLPSNHFATGFKIGALGGGIATFLQLLLAMHNGQLDTAHSWLTSVPLDLSAWSVQLGLTPVAGATRGLLLGAGAAGLATLLAKFQPQVVTTNEG